MTFVVAAGCDIIATCEARTSVTWAWARPAMYACVAGGIVMSCVARAYHDGIVCQATAPAGSPNAAAASGRWVAHISCVVALGRSAANAARKISDRRYRSTLVPPSGVG